jgi:hypothetical protein
MEATEINCDIIVSYTTELKDFVLEEFEIISWITESIAEVLRVDRKTIEDQKL